MEEENKDQDAKSSVLQTVARFGGAAAVAMTGAAAVKTPDASAEILQSPLSVETVIPTPTHQPEGVEITPYPTVTPTATPSNEERLGQVAADRATSTALAQTAEAGINQRSTATAVAGLEQQVKAQKETAEARLTALASTATPTAALTATATPDRAATQTREKTVTAEVKRIINAPTERANNTLTAVAEIATQTAKTTPTFTPEPSKPVGSSPSSSPGGERKGSPPLWLYGVVITAAIWGVIDASRRVVRGVGNLFNRIFRRGEGDEAWREVLKRYQQQDQPEDED